MHEGKGLGGVLGDEVKMEIDLGPRHSEGKGDDQLVKKKVNVRLLGVGNSSSGGGSGGEDSSSDEPVIHHNRSTRHRLPPKKYRIKDSPHNSRVGSPVVTLESGKDEGVQHEDFNGDDDDCSRPSLKENGIHHQFTSGENSDSEMGGYGDGEDGKQDGEDSGKKLFDCDICSMKFSNGANMRRHRMRHTGVKPFECRVCQKRFFRKDHLAEHMATHSKLLPFRCPICNKGFQRQIAMRAHFQNEHVGGSHDIVKACPLCSYKSGSMKSLRIHFYSRHGIDLDGNTPLSQSPSLQNSSTVPDPASPCHNGGNNGEYSELALALGFEDREKSSDSSLIPSHFLVPQIEISSNSPYPPNFPFTANSSYNTQNNGTRDNSSPLNVSPKSDSSSNVPSSSDLVIVKREIMDENHSSPEQSMSSGSSGDEAKPKLSSIELLEEVQDAPEDLSSSGTNSLRSSSHSPPESLIQISPLKSLLREDWKKDTTNCSRLTSTSNGKSSGMSSNGIRSGHSTPAKVSPEGGEMITSSESAGSTSHSFQSRRGVQNPNFIHQCIYCKIVFPDITLYFLHKGCHSDSSPWRCNICGEACCNVYDFNSHLLSKSHQ